MTAAMVWNRETTYAPSWGSQTTGSLSRNDLYRGYGSSRCVVLPAGSNTGFDIQGSLRRLGVLLAVAGVRAGQASAIRYSDVHWLQPGTHVNTPPAPPALEARHLRR